MNKKIFLSLLFPLTLAVSIAQNTRLLKKWIASSAQNNDWVNELSIFKNPRLAHP